MPDGTGEHVDDDDPGNDQAQPDHRRQVQRLAQEGISLAGIQRIMELENHVAALRSRIEELTEELEAHRAASGNRFFAVGPSGDVVPLRHGQRPQRRSAGQALVIWQPRNRP